MGDQRRHQQSAPGRRDRLHPQRFSLVPGDVIALEAGDAVPADARIIECASLKVEESALTGESVPVKKIVDALTSENNKVPLGDRKNMVYMGSSGLRTRTCRCYRHRHEDGDGQDRQRHQRDKEQRNAAADQIESAAKDSQHRRAGHLCIHSPSPCSADTIQRACHYGHLHAGCLLLPAAIPEGDWPPLSLSSLPSALPGCPNGRPSSAS